MIRFGTGLLSIALILCLLPVAGRAQADKIGKADTVYADLAKVDANHWTITVSYVNDETVLGLSIPFKMTAGLNHIVADSAVFTGGRVDDFSFKAFRADTAIQCVLLGLIGPGASRKVLPPGRGRLATIFVSSMDNKPIEKLAIDTTTVHPNNSLMAMADLLQGTPPDTTRYTREDAQIVPAFVIRKQ